MYVNHLSLICQSFVSSAAQTDFIISVVADQASGIRTGQSNINLRVENLPDSIAFKSDILWELRHSLRQLGFIEVVTPVARRADLGTGRRAPADLGDPRFLRTMIGPALRYYLQVHSRIFEVGPCFRLDAPDATHAREFTMLDLYSAGDDFEFLFDLASTLVGNILGTGFERLSVADRVREIFEIDLRSEPPENLAERMTSYLGCPAGSSLANILETFVRRELEPLSAGRGVFLWEFPAGGCEPCAKRTPGSAGILNRFELIYDGIEIIHGYEDESDALEFAHRATEVELYDEEQQIVQQAIAAGRLPAQSVGLAIGIERLCMAATSAKSITTFQQHGPF
jgi:lysyl-tRNA synthetase, class II